MRTIPGLENDIKFIIKLCYILNTEISQKKMPFASCTMKRLQKLSVL